MEAFSLLKYWKGSGGTTGTRTGGSGAGAGGRTNSTTTTILAAVSNHTGDSDAGEDDDGPFFDLEFAVPPDEDEEEEERENQESEKENEEIDEEEEEEKEEEGELVVQIDDSSESEIKSDSKSGQFPISVSLVRSATKFRVFMLGLKRSKSESTTKSETPKQEEHQKQHRNKNKKLFTVKFKEDDISIISLLNRASSNPKPNNSDSCDEKRNKKEVIRKYLKLVKPLQIRVSKKNLATGMAAKTEEVDAAEVAEETAAPAPAKGQKQGLNLKEMAKKHLVKSKSAVHSMPPVMASKRIDDSLLLQQDGIQSAILHCKRSFNSSRDDGEEMASALSRSASDPSHEKKSTATELTRGRVESDVVAV